MNNNFRIQLLVGCDVLEKDFRSSDTGAQLLDATYKFCSDEAEDAANFISRCIVLGR